MKCVRCSSTNFEKGEKFRSGKTYRVKARCIDCGMGKNVFCGKIPSENVKCRYCNNNVVITTNRYKTKIGTYKRYFCRYCNKSYINRNIKYTKSYYPDYILKEIERLMKTRPDSIRRYDPHKDFREGYSSRDIVKIINEIYNFKVTKSGVADIIKRFNEFEEKKIAEQEEKEKEIIIYEKEAKIKEKLSKRINNDKYKINPLAEVEQVVEYFGKI